MEYRSTNPEGYAHFGGDVMSGANSTIGIKLSSNTISPVSDAASAELIIVGKGSGSIRIGTSLNQVFIGDSTTASRFVTGQSTITVPNMAGASQDVSTVTMAGLSTGDIILAMDARGTISTHVAMGGYTISAAAEGKITWVNCHASSIAPETTGVTVRWAYLDRT